MTAESNKKAIVAHHIGTDMYVVAYGSGSLMACGSALIDWFRDQEMLVSFDDISANIMRDCEKQIHFPFT